MHALPTRASGGRRQLGLSATAKELSALFLDLDSDGSGSVDYDEFLNW